LTLAKLVRASIESKDAHFNGIDNVKFLQIIKGYGSKVESFKFIPVFSNLIHIELVFWYHSIHSWDGVVELLSSKFVCFIFFFSIYFDKFSFFIPLTVEEDPLVQGMEMPNFKS